MSIELLATSGSKWLWDEFSQVLVNKAIDKLKGEWIKFQWKGAETKYRSRLKELHSTTRLLGNPKPILIENIFTDVYVLNQMTAFQRYSLQELQQHSINNREQLNTEAKRKPILRLAVESGRLYILGKPGAGKTTLLKYLTLQACLGKIDKTPIFISLKEWVDSGISDVIDFIALQFEICSFPDAKAFIEELLTSQKNAAMILFDGLDEVNQEGNQRADIIRKLTTFSKQYKYAQIIVTCRIASVEYSFEQFKYLEIADFDERQINLFAKKWYQDNRINSERFLNEINKTENSGIKELARTPLLLALICLTFDETLTLPERRVELYRDALDALLKKWDASRGIQRDEIYRYLSPVRKEQMLARIAAQNFEEGNYFIRQETVTKQIEDYLIQLPSIDAGSFPPDGEAVLKAIVAQHGIFVERAYRFYSFMHLSFQEYLTSRYIVENAADGTIDRLTKNHIFDDRWHEVFLIVSSLLDNANSLLTNILNIATEQIDTKSLTPLFTWIEEKTNASRDNSSKTRSVFLYLVMLRSVRNINAQARPLKLEPVKNRKQIEKLENTLQVLLKAMELCLSLNQGLSFGNEEHLQLLHEKISRSILTIGGSKAIYQMFSDYENDEMIIKGLVADILSILGSEFTVIDSEISYSLDTEQITQVLKYLQAITLLIDCLKLAVVPNRNEIESLIFIPLQSS